MSQPAGAPSIHCKDDGSFAEMQCDFRTCWCVTEEGMEIPLSRKNHPQFPSCRKFKGATNTLELACQDDPICGSIDLSDGPACMLRKPKARFESSCFDISSVCDQWLDSCELSAVSSLCAKSCKLCGQEELSDTSNEIEVEMAKCKDSVARCPDWKNDCHSEFTQKLCPSTCGLCLDEDSKSTDIIEDQLSTSPMVCKDIYDFCPQIGFMCDEATTRAMCSKTCSVCGDSASTQNGDASLNCLDWQNFCYMPFVRNNCGATCANWEENYSGDDEAASEGSGNGSGDFEFESSGEIEVAPMKEDLPLSCQGFSLPVSLEEKSILFNGPSSEELCKWSINRPDENQLVMLTVEIMDIRTVNDCSYFVDVYDQGQPVVRLCGSGSHQIVVGTQFDVNVMSYEGFGVEMRFDLISTGAFAIIQEVNKYTTADARAIEECKDAQFCASLKSRCNNDFVSRSCPKTCNKCAQIDYPTSSCSDKLGSLACNEIKEACNSDWSVVNLCRDTCGQCQKETRNVISVEFFDKSDAQCEDEPGCNEIEENRCTALFTAAKMRKSCPVKCGHCKLESSVMECVDRINEDICLEISDGCNQAHVAASCARTCQTCPVSSDRCFDSSELCVSWKSSCSSPFVSALCKQTCESC
ncbi:Oidioi.mRNA.OKI2018_I69.XSR.g15514.t1.cds [Oikopleura dioica]|uniref:Oidioi.mRNA.OKI2018_I69.XSR.g15514.t1.cds n=1 Tax=Oikopleura dioica TaxID=34765 RepID=A0ABN7SI82_OIKDI|nr:Oidioi.mRNA.OKI2018_I69.XSR.g15514.t1.cds [Oikopleura dioica]